MLTALLEQRGARVVEREDATSALTLIGSAPVDVVIADIAMPDIDGCELMKRVRAAGNLVPSIAVTAYARPDDRRVALDAGFTGYLAKPIDGRQLVTLLRAMVPAA
jgi:CheY-like chemotaxis protein